MKKEKKRISFVVHPILLFLLKKYPFFKVFLLEKIFFIEKFVLTIIKKVYYNINKFLLINQK